MATIIRYNVSTLDDMYQWYCVNEKLQDDLMFENQGAVRIALLYDLDDVWDRLVTEENFIRAVDMNWYYFVKFAFSRIVLSQSSERPCVEHLKYCNSLKMFNTLKEQYEVNGHMIPVKLIIYGAMIRKDICFAKALIEREELLLEQCEFDTDDRTDALRICYRQLHVQCKNLSNNDIRCYNFAIFQAHAAVYSGDYWLCRFFRVYRYNCLQQAYMSGKPDIVRQFIARGCNVQFAEDVLDSDGQKLYSYFLGNDKTRTEHDVKEDHDMFKAMFHMSEKRLYFSNGLFNFINRVLKFGNPAYYYLIDIALAKEPAISLIQYAHARVNLASRSDISKYLEQMHKRVAINAENLKLACVFPNLDKAITNDKTEIMCKHISEFIEHAMHKVDGKSEMSEFAEQAVIDGRWDHINILNKVGYKWTREEAYLTTDLSILETILARI